jgi:hypothetical protein
MIDHDQEWKRWRSWLGEEPKGLNIYSEMVEMLGFRAVWRGFAIVYNRAPEEARSNATFLWWVNWNYARGMGSSIRRQVDAGPDVISLGRLMERIWRYPTVLSRERFLALRDVDDRAPADRWFSEELGSGDFINPEIPAADTERLRSETAEVRRWVNKAVAHSDRHRPPGAPVFKEIHHCLDVTFELFQKYMLLIRGVHVVSDVIMSAWPTIFRTTWIPDERSWISVMEAVHRAEREGLQDDTL